MILMAYAYCTCNHTHIRRNTLARPGCHHLHPSYPSWASLLTFLASSSDLGGSRDCPQQEALEQG